jgi:TolA-binding protein
MPQPAANSNLPAAARRQVKEANRLIAELNARPGEVPQNTNVQVGGRRAEWIPGSTAPPAAPAPAAAAPGPNAQPVVAPPAVDPLVAAEHKFNVLAGKYNAETSRLGGAVQALQAENAALLARVAAPAAAPAPARAEDQFDTSMVSAKERTEYGEELIQMMARIAKANGGAETKRLQDELNAMRGTVQQTQQIGTRALQERVWQQLDNQVPEWRTINVSQQFVDWLEIPDIMSGVARKHGLTQAFGVGDGTRVAGIFKRFIEEDSRARSTAPAPAHQAQVDPATLIAPGSPRGTGGEAPNSASGEIWTEQQIDDFYSRVQRKRIKPEEAAAIEAQILAAVRDGRVIPRRDDRFLANAR